MKKYIAGLLSLLVFGCELIVDIDVPFERPQLTLNSIFHDDSLWTAHISLNRHILNDTPFQKVDNALVVLYQNNLPIDTLTGNRNGKYQSSAGKPIAGNTYEIRATADNFGTVTARSYIPLPAPITNVEIAKSSSVDGVPENTVRLKFEDDPAAQNYYQIILETEDETVDFQTGLIRLFRRRVGIVSADPASQDENPNSWEGIIFKDIFFNGKETDISFKTLGYFQNAGSFIITLRTLGEDCYKYKTTAQLQHSTSGDPFAQPVNVYNNVENGFGIFAGFSQSVYAVSNPRPIINSITPLRGKPGDHIIITGENFTTTSQSFPSVMFNGTPYPTSGQPVRITEHEMEVIIPSKAISGKIYVSNGGRVTVSDVSFEVIN
jgi:hypothetical protein